MYTERTLIASASDRGLDAIAGFIKSNGFGNATIITSGNEVRRLVTQDNFGLIIINTPLLDESGVQLAAKLCESTHAAVILIVKADAAEEVAMRTMDYGVCVLARPLNKIAFHQTLMAATAGSRRLIKLEKDNQKLRNKLEEQRYVSRAKLLLITQNHMTEEEAHKYIERNAMDTRRTRKEVSMEIIAKFS